MTKTQHNTGVVCCAQGWRQQRGATLVVSMIMLLMLTLIGVAGMRDTMLQEKMAGNLRDRELALQAAEAALRQGEAAAKTAANWGIPGYIDQTGATGGIVRIVSGYPFSAAPEQLYWNPDKHAWNSSDSVAYVGTLTDVAKQPRFVVEKLPKNMTSYAPAVTKFAAGAGAGGLVTAADLTPKRASVSRQDYRVTAIGWGITGTAAVVLQSTYWR